jgi:hypothetical protein
MDRVYVRWPIALSDATDVIDRWAKLYRFGRAALN